MLGDWYNVSNRKTWYAFTKLDSGYSQASLNSGNYCALGLDFQTLLGKSVRITKCDVYSFYNLQTNGVYSHSLNLKMQGSNDNATWIDISQQVTITGGNVNYFNPQGTNTINETILTSTSSTRYRYARIYMKTTDNTPIGKVNSHEGGFNRLYFYGS